MNEQFRKPPTVSYDADYALWSAEQAALLRAGRFDVIDRENLAEEVEGLGRSDRYEIEHRLEILLLHLLKWEYQPKRRKSGWRSTIREQRLRLNRLVGESPSLKNYPSLVLEDAYRIARAKAEDETGIAFEQFPEACPFVIQQVLDAGFLPEG